MPKIISYSWEPRMSTEPMRQESLPAPGTGKESQDAENACRYGCIACGKCEEVCRFGAIAVRDNVACVDEELCIACKRCVKECPQGIIRIHECADYIAVKCSNKEK